MKKLKLILVLIALLFLSANPSIAQYKLNIGNFWVYSTEYQEYRIAVIDTATFFDSVHFFEVYRDVSSLSKSTSGNSSQYYIRKKNDDFYERLNINHNTNDTVVTDDVFYKYNAQLGDKWIYRIAYYEDSTVVDTSWSEVIDVFEGYQFGEWRIIKKIHYYSEHPQVPLDFHKYFCDDFGELSEENYIEVVSWLKGCYIDGVAYGDTSFITVSVTDDLFPNEFYLLQNYPNPFNPSTNIEFTMPESEFVELSIFNTLGQKVKTLINDVVSSGYHNIKFKGENLSSGIYYYQIKTKDISEVKKMLLLR
ncbi:MAG: T9SS type A sorting domain-containing protein [Melioribacteraceae bacterium]|nr:T9SS type A sorting domain-containing protein [Saprospiraceae bacterium]MCF8355908.1 T9SS type A sorting domain-containing protein [Melioribacteraceae bacterium]MCF8395448.1 T9SS type A sorting domain-containing protein [Melioribacteraceae bacterium]